MDDDGGVPEIVHSSRVPRRVGAERQVRRRDLRGGGLLFGPARELRRHPGPVPSPVRRRASTAAGAAAAEYGSECSGYCGVGTFGAAGLLFGPGHELRRHTGPVPSPVRTRLSDQEDPVAAELKVAPFAGEAAAGGVEYRSGCSGYGGVGTVGAAGLLFGPGHELRRRPGPVPSPGSRRLPDQEDSVAAGLQVAPLAGEAAAGGVEYESGCSDYGGAGTFGAGACCSGQCVNPGAIRERFLRQSVGDCLIRKIPWLPS
jgi:hypothetical protein